MSCSLTLSAEISNVKFMGSPMCLQADKEFQKGQKTPKIAQEKAQHVLTVNVFNDIVKFSQKKKKKGLLSFGWWLESSWREESLAPD